MTKPALAIALACACASPTSGPPDGGVVFIVGGLELRVASGAAVTANGKLTLYLSDQLDTCQALAYMPQLPVTMLSVVVQPADTHAAIGAGASATLVKSTHGTVNARFDASDGSLSWTANNDGSVAISAIDLGFAGTGDRIAAADLSPLPRCSP